MRNSNALKKVQETDTDYTRENLSVIKDLWEAHRRRIALQVEQACNLPGNTNGPDLGEFEEKYSIKSNFA